VLEVAEEPSSSKSEVAVALGRFVQIGSMILRRTASKADVPLA
jgi:hypothetical protein